MRNFLLIVLFLISANVFAQQKDEYFVKNNGDTVFCKINNTAIYSRGLFKKKKPKNELTYTTQDVKGRTIINLDDVQGYKLKKQFYFYKIHLERFKSEDLYKTDSIYDFFPKVEGGYVKGGVEVLNKGNLRFYRIADVQNQHYVSNGFGGYTVIPNAYFVEVNDSGNAKELPTVTGKLFSKNNLDAWNILKSYCENDSKTVGLIENCIKQNKRCNDKNIEIIIGEFVGKRFKDAPKQKIKKS